MLSFSISVGDSHLRLVAALKDLFNAKGVSSMHREPSIAFTPVTPNHLPFNVFGARNSPILFIKGTHLSPL